MSKKKAFSGSTMTLKDFHGGSIPSDIPLPSAPGVIVRPTDRPSYDRQGSWGNHIGRSDNRLQPNSSGSIRTLDDKTPFLTDTANIGRNFDEDERKPLDGLSRPRRTVSDESLVGPQQLPVESKVNAGKLPSYHQPQGSLSGSETPICSGGPYAARAVEGVSRASLGGGSYHNAWDVRKESLGAPETTSFSGAGQTNSSKFAQASAFDKVSSGRWQTRLIHHQADVEIIRQPESNLSSRDITDTFRDSIVDERESSEAMLVRHVERGLAVDRATQGGTPRDISGGERSPVSVDGRERIFGPVTRAALFDPDEKMVNAQSQLPVEVSERPKLKLLPRTKPLDVSEPPVINYKQRLDENHLGLGIEQQGASNHLKSGLTVGEAGDPVTERPKLNLKPRTQPYGQANKITERERKALFGGARPRELVLKERVVDDIFENQDVAQIRVSTNERSKKDAMRTEAFQAHSSAQWQSGRAEILSHDHRSPKYIDHKDQRINIERGAVADQRKNWRNDKWKNANSVEKQQNYHLVQHNQERSRSPETWRKPVEQPKPQGVRYGKAVSAVELVQAFSKPVVSSVEAAKPIEQFSGPKGRSSSRGPQTPFSRLMGSTTQVNGY